MMAHIRIRSYANKFEPFIAITTLYFVLGDQFWQIAINECGKVLLNYCEKLIIMGDLNFKFSSQQTKFLLPFIKQFLLHELVEAPTRVTVLPAHNYT